MANINDYIQYTGDPASSESWRYKSWVTAGSYEGNEVHWFLPWDRRYDTPNEENFTNREWHTYHKTAIYILPTGGVAIYYCDRSYSDNRLLTPGIWHGIVRIGSSYETVDVLNAFMEVQPEGLVPGMITTLPIFTDYAEMNEYLLSYDVDPTPYGGTWAGNITPDDPEGDSDPITGLADYTGICEGNNPTLALATINATNLTKISELLRDGWLSGDGGKAIISLKHIIAPGAIYASSTDTTIIHSEGLLHTVDVNGKLIRRQMQHFNMGTFNFSKVDSFLSYSPYTSIEIYLPYCGTFSLSPKDVEGSILTVDCAIDFVTGDLVYYLTVYNLSDGETGLDRVLYQFNGNCSYDMPLSAEDYAGKVSRLTAGGLAIAGAIATSMVTGGAGALIGSGVATSSTLPTAFSEDTVTCGSISSNLGFSGIQYPYIIIRRPKTAIPSNYNEAYGRPCMKTLQLGTLTGYTVVDEIHIDNYGSATDTELNEIERLLKSGVIL